MAPEQALGNTSATGPRTDVYALGAILYELLTGRPPFKGATPLETLDQVRGSEPVPPSRLAPKLPPDLETICMKAMAKESARRYQSAGELGDDLRRFLNGEPIHARPVGRFEKAWRWCRRNPAVAALSAAVGSALVAATIVSILFAAHSERARGRLSQEQAQTARERDDKDEALKVQRQALDLAVAALRDLTGDIVEEQMARGSELTDENKAFLRKIIQRFDDLAAITADDAESRIIRAEGHASVGLMRYRLGEMKDAEKAYNEAVSLCKQLVAEFPASVDYRRKLAQSQYNFGMLLRDTGRLKDAEPAYAEALTLRKQLAAEHPRNPEFRVSLAQSLGNQGVLFSIKSQHKEAETALADALAAYKQLAADFPERPVYRREMAGTHGNLGNLYGVTDRPEKKESAYKAAHAIRQELAAEFPTNSAYLKDLATSHNNLGVHFRMTNRYKEAESAFAAALGILAKLADDFPTRPEFSRELARSHNSLGALLYTMDRLKDAEAAYGDAVEIQRKLAADSPNQPDLRNNLAGTLGNLAVLCNQRRDFAAARAHIDAARPHHEAALKANSRHPHYRQYYRNNLSALVAAQAGLLDRAGALRTAQTIRDFGWDPPANAYDAAIALAKAIRVVEKTETLNADVRSQAVNFYADHTMAMLRDAVAKGFKDSTRLTKVDHFDPLRQRDDFTRLLADLAVKK
jgi:tetratricopeptide (TPR) repeat protein